MVVYREINLGREIYISSYNYFEQIIQYVKNMPDLYKQSHHAAIMLQ